MIGKGIQITIKGTNGAPKAPSLDVAPSDPVVVKKCYRAFFKTDLEHILQLLKPEELVLAGINTHARVRMTAIARYQREWKVIAASACVDSYDREHHEISLKYMKDKIASIITNEEMRKVTFNRLFRQTEFTLS